MAVGQVVEGLLSKYEALSQHPVQEKKNSKINIYSYV
jgi:hypothetical protein